MLAPHSAAVSPATMQPLPAFQLTPPPLLEHASPPLVSPPPSPSIYPPHAAPANSPPPALSNMAPLPTNSGPPVSLPATSAPPIPSSTVPLPRNSKPPVKSPEIPVPPVFSPPSPETSLVPASWPPITSNESPDSPPPPSPVVSFTPAAPLPSPVVPPPETQPPPLPFVAAPVTITFPPPTASFPPPAFSAEMPPATIPFTEPPWSSGTTPSHPMFPATAPEGKSPSTPPSGSLPVAVEFRKPSSFHMSSGLIVGLVIGAIIFASIVAIGSVLCRNRKKKNQKNQCSNQRENSSPRVGSKGSHVIQVLSNPKLPPLVNSGSTKATPNQAPNIALNSMNGIFTYDELVAATNAFSESNLLGQGGFGYVYKGILSSGKEIAVKQLKTGSQQGEREFQTEVETISRVHHKHLVELVGYCVTRAERLLVYEFVPNNTLEFHLHGEGKPVIEWATRIKIALGSAKGLAYLHEDCNPAIVHRDIKASNILLDFKFEAKVSDFGLAKIFPETDTCITHLTTRVVGTFGYLAPEYASSGKLTDKSDVYSYGVMLLELITGRPPITTAGSRNQSLVDWARPLLAQALEDGDFNNLVDPRLQTNYDSDEMIRMITCAAACVRHSARLRPRMSRIVGALEGLVSLTDVVRDVTPGHTTLHSWSDSSGYAASQYQQDIRNYNLALSFQKYSSGWHSESTSAYGLHPSPSNSSSS